MQPNFRPAPVPTQEAVSDICHRTVAKYSEAPPGENTANDDAEAIAHLLTYRQITYGHRDEHQDVPRHRYNSECRGDAAMLR